MQDNNLIFLISQPRSGSSMLQQILLQNSDIVSFPEPWFMLPLIYTYKYPGSNVIYNLNFANINFMEYLGRYENGLEQFKQEIKKLALNLYELSSPGDSQYILDKTPRYYHIADELYEMFPEAKFVFLIRNPVAVFASMLSYNFQGNLNRFLHSPDRLEDLLKAPKIIVSQKNKQRENHHFINYESIIHFPDKSLQSLSDFLGIEPLSPEYQINTVFKESRGVDAKSVAQHNKPVSHYVDSWKSSINNKQKKASLVKYLETLGNELVAELGYDYREIIHDVTNHQV